MKGRGARISKLVKPRPPKHSLAQLNLNKLTLEPVPYSTDMEKRLEGQGGFDEAHCDSGLQNGITEIMESPAKNVIDKNNNIRQSLDLDDIDVEIEKQPCRLEDVEISAIISTTDNSSVTDSEDYVDALEYLAPHEAETVVEVLQIPETEHELVQAPQIAEKEHELVQAPLVAETEDKLVQAPQVAETEHKLVQTPLVAEKEHELVQAPQVADDVWTINRRVFPTTRQSSVINSTMAMKRVRTPSGTDHAVVDSKVQGNSQECNRVDEIILGELEHMEQIVYNLQSYQFLHPEVICMCDSLKKIGHKIKSYFPAQSSKLFTELKRVANQQVRGVHPAIPKHLIACGVVTIEKEQTIGQLSAVSTKALYDVFTDVVANEEVEQDGEPTTALLATVSSKTFHNALTSAVIESNQRPTLPQVWESHGAKESTAYPGSDKSSSSGAQHSKRVAFEAEPARQPHHTIRVNALRTPCVRKEITFTLEEKLKTVSSWPPSMLEGFLNDSTDPVDAVKRLITSLEAECRFISRPLRCDTRAETHTCKCEVAGRSFPVGYGFNAEEAKVEAALNVLTNTIGGPRDRFIKKELHRQSIKKDHTPIVVSHRSDDTTRSTEDWQLSHPPHPNRNNRITSPTKSVSLPHSTPKKQPHVTVSTDSLWKKLRLVVRYPTPTLQTYLDDLSDPIASVAHLSYCLEWKEKFMNDVITDDSQEKLHSSICRIGNLAFTPGYGVDIQTANNEAARNAINDILSTAKENAK